jgi:hypothetical protein
MPRWTQEQRDRQAELIRTSKIWERSTGPRTELGKAVVARNALKHGMRSAAWVAERKMFNELMQEVQRVLSEQTWRT